MPHWNIILGNIRDGLPDGSVHCCVTSPPYWGLRDYGVDGQLGLEATPAEFVAGMVAAFREVRRVLRDDGTAWVNMGDAYANPSSGGGGAVDVRTDGRKTTPGDQVRGRETGANTMAPGLKQKDLVGMPWMLAFALREDGWYLRSDIIWAKPNPMPESVTDRPTKSHEYLFLLAKEPRYFFDAEAVKEDAIHAGRVLDYTGDQKNNDTDDVRQATRPKGRMITVAPGRNIRTVWTIPTQAYPDAHFATFPERLVEPCVKAGTSERGCCPACGGPWERVVEKSGGTTGRDWHPKDRVNDGLVADKLGGHAEWADYQCRTVGWRPTCKCNAGEPVPCTVLDPFTGSGTTGEVAVKMGRNFVGLELNPAYREMARKRIGGACPLLAQERIPA